MGYYIDIEYNVDEKNKVVIASTVVDWRRELDRLEGNVKAELREGIVEWSLCTDSSTRYSWKPERFSARARWDGDEALPWDPEFGKMLARARLVNKVDRAYVKMMDQILKEMVTVLEKTRILCEKDWRKINDESERRKMEINETANKVGAEVC